MRQAALLAAIGLLAAVSLPPPRAAAAGPPSVEAVSVGQIGATSAEANAEIDPNGLATGWRFEYVAATAYEANLASGRDGFAGAATAPGAGEAAPITLAQTVAWPLTGLEPNTTYRLRAVAENGAGVAIGSAEPLFTTGSVEILCEGDSCQPLPPAPEETVVDTLIFGPGNPAVRYRARKRRHRHVRHRGHRRHGGRRHGSAQGRGHRAGG